MPYLFQYTLPDGYVIAGWARSASDTLRQHATGVALNGGGPNYQVDDILTVVGGTFAVACQIRVLGIDKGNINVVAIEMPGSYTAIPANPVSVTGGSGTGATFNIDWSGLIPLDDLLMIDGETAAVGPFAAGSNNFVVLASPTAPTIDCQPATAIVEFDGSTPVDVVWRSDAGRDPMYPDNPHN